MIRTAVVGVGAIAEVHLACLTELTGVQVVSVSDLSPARAEATAERFGVSNWCTSTDEMLEQVRPDVVHITTPPGAHFSVAMSALAAGAHVVVEKPVTVTYGEWTVLRDEATSRRLRLLENQNYRFSRGIRQLQNLIRDGSLSQVHQVDVRFFQRFTGADHAFADPFVPHPALDLPRGPISDFLPHMASLVHAFLGPHSAVHAEWLSDPTWPTVPFVDMAATVRTASGMATLSFSGRSAPDGFWVGVFGDDWQARVNLYEGRLTMDRVRSGPAPLHPLANALGEARGTTSAALGSLWGKLTSKPGSYEGLWHLLGAFYDSLASGDESPLSLDDVDATSRLVDALTSHAGGQA